MSVVPPTRRKGFGVTSVSGRMRSPRPAARIIAFTRLHPRHSYAFSLLLAQQQGLHRLARRPPVINHLADLLVDGHLHAAARRPPIATPSRMISARPRVTSAARALAPKPRPSAMPAAIASTFLTAPPTSTPITSSLV